jgi:hypothetical protein
VIAFTEFWGRPASVPQERITGDCAGSGDSVLAAGDPDTTRRSRAAVNAINRSMESIA